MIRKKLLFVRMVVLAAILTIVLVIIGCGACKTETNEVSKKDIEFILSREIFIFKEDLFELYGQFVENPELFEPYRDGWKFGDLINDQYFLQDSIEWSYITDNRIENADGVYFSGVIKETETKIKILFTWNDGAKIPMLGMCTLEPKQGEKLESWSTEYAGADALEAVFMGDVKYSSIFAVECYGYTE